MHLKIFFLLGSLLITSNSLAESNYINQYKKNFFLICSKDMSSGEDAFPYGLGMAVCSCSASSIVSSYNETQLKAIEKDYASNYHLITPLVKSCTNSEFEKYIQNHPEFLEQYIKAHPEVLH